MSYCINENTKEWKKLLSQTDDNLARMTYNQYGSRYPDLVNKTDLKRDIGFKTEMENFAGMARKLGKYNTKHGTSHSFSKTRVYGNTWKLELHMNYLHRSVETERRRRALKEPLYVSTSVPSDSDMGTYSANTESPSNQSFTNKYTPSKSEQQAGRFDEEGNFKPNDDFGDTDFNIDTEIQQEDVEAKVRELEKEGLLEIDCKGKLKAEKGLATSFTKGGKWKVIKDLKGYPTHKEGGIDLTIGKDGVSIKNGNTQFTAKHGLVIPKN